jgi:hypothetical protein
MKFLVLSAVVLLALLAGCASTDGASGRPYRGGGYSIDCQAILSDPWGGPEKLPAGCY